MQISGKAGNVIGVERSGVGILGVRENFGLVLVSDERMCWSSSGIVNTPDTLLNREEAGVIGQKNGLNPQAFRLYNTYTDASNYERLEIKWDGNVCILQAASDGAGVQRDLRIVSPTLAPGSSRTPASNGDLEIEATNDTTLTFKFKGSDGTVRSGTIALT